MMYEDELANRLAELRTERGVSARDMSLSLGQNPGYINTIEARKALPSMSGFFYICEYLQIRPEEFFQNDLEHPAKIREISEDLAKLSEEDLDLIHRMVEALTRRTD